LSGQYLAEISEDAARSICYLSVSSEGRATMVAQSAIPALIVLVKRVPQDSPVHALCALALQYFSWSKSSQKRVVVDGGAKLLVQMSMFGTEEQTVRDREIARDCGVAFANLSHRPDLRKELMEDGVIDAAVKIVDNGRIQHDTEYIWRICATIHHLCLEPSIRAEITRKGGVHVIVSLAKYANDASKQMCAASICNISKSKSSRERIVKDGAVECLISLANCNNRLTKRYCAIALSNLSAYATVEDGTVSALLGMNNVQITPSRKDKKASVALLSPKSKKRVAEEGGTEGDDGGDGDKVESGNDVSPSKATRLKQVLAGGLFKGATENIAHSVMQHSPEEELLGLPPPTVSTLGSPEDHDAYFKKLLSSEGYFGTHTCEYDQYEAGFATWSLPPPKPNSVDSILESDEDGKKDKGKGNLHSNPVDDHAFPLVGEKLNLKPEISPEEEKALTEKEQLAEMAAQKEEREEKEKQKGGRDSQRKLKKRGSWRSEKRRNSKELPDPIEAAARSARLGSDFSSGTSTYGRGATESFELYSSEDEAAKRAAFPSYGSNVDVTAQTDGMGDDGEELTAIERLDVALKKKASDNSMVGKEKMMNSPARKKSTESLPPPTKKEPTPVKPIFQYDLDSDKDKALLSEAMRAANSARVIEKRASKRASKRL